MNFFIHTGFMFHKITYGIFINSNLCSFNEQDSLISFYVPKYKFVELKI
jgi:hypothetical protein